MEVSDLINDLHKYLDSKCVDSKEYIQHPDSNPSQKDKFVPILIQPEN